MGTHYFCTLYSIAALLLPQHSILFSFLAIREKYYFGIDRGYKSICGFVSIDLSNHWSILFEDFSPNAPVVYDLVYFKSVG